MSSVPENVAGRSPERTQVFAYINADNAPLYRTIMRVFTESKQRFLFQLRPQDVLEAVRISVGQETSGQPEIDSGLEQLCEWGNLQKHPDTTSVGTVDDFLKQRYVFQITRHGEAAERALAFFDAAREGDGELQSTALADIRYLVQELKQLSREAEPDAGKIHRNLLVLRTRFEDLSASAQAFIERLERSVHLQSVVGARQLIDYGERFVGDVVLAADSIGETIRDLGAAGLERLIQAVAESNVRGPIAATPEGIAAVCDQWRSDWKRFRDWFISHAGRPSNAEMLRERARTLIPALLGVITNTNDRQIHRIDRFNDFRVLARWFAEAESDAEAHRLWRAVFGLCPARHLIINDQTLDEYEARQVPANTSWLEAPPLRIAMRPRDYGRFSPAADLSCIIDRTAEKEKLAAAAHEEALRILSAQGRFGVGGRMRLSELEHLETGEFDLFVGLLGEAVSARVFANEPVEIFSGDGRLRVKLEPTGDGREALILTTNGVFRGPDHWISIEHILSVDGVLR